MYGHCWLIYILYTFYVNRKYNELDLKWTYHLFVPITRVYFFFLGGAYSYVFACLTLDFKVALSRLLGQH